MEQLIDLERMRARLAQIDAEREPLLALIRAAEAYEGVVGKSLFTNESIVARPRMRIQVVGGRSAPIMAATEKVVGEVLEAMDTPLGTGDLVELIGNKPELNLPEKNAVNVLSARLSNSDKFETQRGVGWWFKNRPWPARFVPTPEPDPDDFDDLLDTENASE